MKKLLVLAAVAAMAMGVQAESTTWNWNIYFEAPVLKEPGKWDVLPSATAYIFASKTGGSGATVSQASLVDAFAAGTLNLAEMGALDSQPLSEGILVKDAGTFTYDAEATEFFFALVDNSLGRERLFISTASSSTEGQIVGNEIGFDLALEASLGEARGVKFGELDAAGGYQRDAWYGRAAAAPEPTSGLLLLLGVAGLALKRRRA